MHILQTANAYIDFLAKLGVDLSDKFRVWDVALVEILALLHEDVRGVMGSSVSFFYLLLFFSSCNQKKIGET